MTKHLLGALLLFLTAAVSTVSPANAQADRPTVHLSPLSRLSIRATPAGDVFVTGSADDDDLEVCLYHDKPNPPRISVTESLGPSMGVTGSEIHGNFRNLRFDLRGGDDRARFCGRDWPNTDLTVVGGPGALTFEVSGESIRIHNLTVRGAGEADSITLSGLIEITGRTALVTGGGDDSITADGDITLAGRLSAVTAGGSDSIRFRGVSLLGRIALMSTGVGNDTIEFHAGTTVYSRLSVLAGAGADTLDTALADRLGRVDSYNAVMGPGPDTVIVDRTERNDRFNGGGGRDVLTVCLDRGGFLRSFETVTGC